MKLAFISSLAPTMRPDTGFEIANAAIIEALRATGHHVTIFAFARPDDQLKPDPDLVVLGRMTIENHLASKGRKLAWLATALVKRLPFASAKLWLGGGSKVMRQIAEHGPFDRIILNSVMMPGAFPALAAAGNCILIAHNIEHASASQNATHASNPALKWLYAREAALLKQLEARLARDCGFVWCLAEEDRRALAGLGGHGFDTRSAVLPLVSTSVGRLMKDDQTLAHDVGLIGTWTWEPNLIGLRWFIAEVMPLLPPELSVAVAGRTPPDLDVPANLNLLGRVPDAAEFLGSCAVTALVSRAGTGVQLKTIEALQLGLPAVATTLSMRGLGQPPGNVRMADDAVGFARVLTEQVAAVRAGSVQRLDGSVFMRAQAAALDAAISAGLAATPTRS